MSMKVIVATEEVLNEYGDLIKTVFRYEDETKKRKKK